MILQSGDIKAELVHTTYYKVYYMSLSAEIEIGKIVDKRYRPTRTNMSFALETMQDLVTVIKMMP